MKKYHLLLISLSLTFLCKAQTQNRSPLIEKPYLELPLGQIKAKGWLEDQLIRMRDGLTGNLDERYEAVIGSRNGWLGGDGDAWERGPYWVDGLVPLAYILNDQQLINKAKPWIEWTLTNQREDGYIGPKPLKEKSKSEPGIQKEPVEDWWPRMVMLKVLMQYHEATKDPRVISVLTNYFRYQLEELPETPLDQWSFWANRRGADNLMVVYWLYNLTGDQFLLDLGHLIYKQTFPFQTVFTNSHSLKPTGVDHLYPYNVSNRYPFNQDLIKNMHVGQQQSFHCVNLAQGIKTPVIYYQQSPDPAFISSVKQAFADIDIFHGQAQGMFGGDEPMHGNAPTQGVEFCSVVEMMYSLESMLPITADVAFADHLEKIAFNALPTQATDDFNHRQYFQTANQVLISKANRNFYEDHAHQGTDQCFGLLTGYPCCTSNMHQGWPKFVQNLWYQTADGGVAALVYAPNELTTRLPNGQQVHISEETNYPFEESIRFRISLDKESAFPLHLRIPSWAKQAQVFINGELQSIELKHGTIAKINRNWKDGDQVELLLPMKITTSRWAEMSVAVERGPLIYALKVEEEWSKVADKQFDDYYEVYPKSDWNYGLIDQALKNPEAGFEVVISNNTTDYPWNHENTPILLKTKAKKIPSWKLYNHAAGPLPLPFPETEGEAVDVVLIPYGSSTLRISQFPVVR
ncbi:beta-L-arabinofuranosidase domain-containing protein [Sphingobacterium hungaricum]